MKIIPKLVHFNIHVINKSLFFQTDGMHTSRAFQALFNIQIFLWYIFRKLEISKLMSGF
jgi:hypothetical protein